MSKTSAGIILYKKTGGDLRFFLVHPGGPFWKNKNTGAWTIPKGETEKNEDLLAAAIREFFEETGMQPEGNFIELAPIKQKAGKIIYAWALEGDFDIGNLRSNSFEIEWPPRSGRSQSFPEIDKAAWCDINEAREKINPAQLALLEQLDRILKGK